MRPSSRFSAAMLAIAALAAAPAPGCGPPQSVSNSPEHYDMGALEEVGQLYVSAYNAKKKPPASLKDCPKADLFMSGVNAIKGGEIVVYWGVVPTPGDAAAEGASEVVAYKADVPDKGGYVLLKDMSIKAMTPEEFKAAPKPSTPTSAGAKKG